ncbi:MAG: hypothetical protein JNN00_09305 [Chitinophagaceae bacterium]|nr:hypothetical protein [Chitinophagaceae bacterium]
MKQQFIMSLAVLLGLQASPQNKIPTETPCTDVMAQTAKGRWIKSNDLGTHNSKETNSLQDKIHELILKIYPEPKGVDAVWHRSAGISYFGSKRKYYKTNDDRLTFDYFNTPHFLQYTYTAGFFRYRCDAYEKNILHPGYPGETGTWLNIIANGNIGYPLTDDNWTINGLPVMTMKPAQYKEDGYEFYYPEPDRNVRGALVYRKGGVLPYITVTRKQYLDYCTIFHSKTADVTIRGFEQMPVRSAEEQEKEKNTKIARLQKQFANDAKKLQANIDYYLSGYKTDQQIRDEKIREAKKIKEDIVKKFTDEMEKSKNEGLLNSPAMVRVMYYAEPVFETDPVLGMQVITENPDYIRKDLPKHVPQLFEINLVWNEWKAQANFAKIFQEKFPTDKLQAIIDK